MDIRVGPRLRFLRGGLAAMIAGSLGVFAHLSAGGLLPSLPQLMLIGAFLFAATTAALGVPASRLRMVAIIAGGQFGCHLVLTVLAGHAGDHSAAYVLRSTTSPSLPTTPMAGGRTGSYFDQTMAAAPEVGTGIGIPHWATHIIDDLTGPHAVMASAHLLAAVAVAVWLAIGEQALIALVLLLAAVVVGLIHPALRVVVTLAVRTPGVQAPWRRAGLAPQLRADIGSTSRRGPPGLLR